MKKFILELLKKAGIRALWTFLQAAIAMIVVGQKVEEVEWLAILSVGFVAALVSFMKSIVTGLPEAETDGTLLIDKSNSYVDLFRFDVENLSKIDAAKTIRLKVDPTAIIPRE